MGLTYDADSDPSHRYHGRGIEVEVVSKTVVYFSPSTASGSNYDTPPSGK